jgi:hypothetical protein
MMEWIIIGALIGLGMWLAPLILTICFAFLVFLAAVARIIYLGIIGVFK